MKGGGGFPCLPLLARIICKEIINDINVSISQSQIKNFCLYRLLNNTLKVKISKFKFPYAPKEFNISVKNVEYAIRSTEAKGSIKIKDLR